MSGGKYTETAGDSITFVSNKGTTIYADNINLTANGKVELSGETGNTMNSPLKYREPTKHLQRGWWTDEYDNEITPGNRVRIGRSVTLNLQTTGISEPKGKTVSIELIAETIKKEIMWFCLYVIPPIPYPHLDREDTEIRIYDENTDNTINTVTLDESGKAQLKSIRVNADFLYRKLDAADFLQLYVVFTYKAENGILETLESEPLNIIKTDQNLYLKRAVRGNPDYSLPEFRTAAGEIIIYALQQIKEGKIARLKTVTVNIRETITTIEQIERIKQTLYTERIFYGSATDPQQLAAGYKTTLVNSYYRATKVETKVVETTATAMAPKRLSDYLNCEDLLTGAKNTAKNLADGIDIIQKIVDLYNMVLQSPEEKQKISNLNLATLVNFIPGAEMATLCLDISGMIAQNMKDEMEENIHTGVIFELEQRKNQGWEEVKSFLYGKDGLSDRGFRYVSNVPQDALNKLLNGEILTYMELSEAAEEERKKLSNPATAPATPENLYFIVLIPYNPKDSSYMVDSIFMQNKFDIP